MNKLGSGLIMRLAKAAVTGITCMVLSVAFVSPSFAFPIATGGASMNSAFDGTNYLVGVENHQTSTTSIGAQLIDTSGNKVGVLISPSTASTGISANVAFDGANYLLIWEYDPGGTGSGRFQIYGQFISKTGALVGSAFAITTPGIWFEGIKTMAFGGGKYLVTYSRLIDPDHNDDRLIAGRIVSPNGTMGDEFTISGGYGRESDVAFDGANFFVVWCAMDNAGNYSDIRGRFVSPAGVAGMDFSVNDSVANSDNPKSVAFDGTNYMVIWNDEIGGLDSGEWNVSGQRISTAGVKVGYPFTINSEAGRQLGTSVAFDGTNYLAVWIDMKNDVNGNGVCEPATEGTCWDVYGQYISKSGSLVGSKVAVNTDTENQMGGVGFANGRYLVLINSGVIMGESGISQVASANGIFFGANGAVGTGNISISPNPVNFVSVQVGSSSAPQTVTITNSGLGTLTVSFSNKTGDNSQFTTEPGGTNPCPGLPHTFASGASCTLIATFTPTSVGAITATMVIGSDAANTPFLNLPLNGTGFGQLSLTTNITGSGSINSVNQPPVFSCSAPSCTASYDSGTTFTLRATPSSYFTFAGWNENGCTGTGDCTFTLNSNTTFNVAFSPVPLVQVVGNPTVFQSLQAAYGAVADGSTPTLRARNVTFPENFNLNRAVYVTLKGGLESDFTMVNGYTYLQGILTLGLGSLTVDYLVVR